ncbi:MAG TPA: NigD-like C-terminal domain-containing protein [Chitinispirillaceae bacterium]|nr:NigD-like C-terminal domain-containing protein [Chitinispirillaceae bacterium]
MSWRNFIASLITGVIVMHAEACIDPMSVYSVGIIFSKGEQINTQNIENFSPDTSAYIKTCRYTGGYSGRMITIGIPHELKSDFLTIDSAWVESNTLLIDVKSGGGCRVHRYDIYTDTSFVSDSTISLYLTHDANGDNCKAMVSERLAFNLASIGDLALQGKLKIYAPGNNSAYTPAPQWGYALDEGILRCSYKIKSACSDRVMTYVGEYNGFSTETKYYQLLVIFDSSMGIPSDSEKTAAVKAEIERMNAMNVFLINDLQVESIEEKLKGGQYWTAEDSVLGFNMWFNGVGVNGVKGVYSAQGCGSGVDYELPSKKLNQVTAVLPVKQSKINGNFRVVARNNILELTGLPITNNSTGLRITDMSGRTIAVINVPSGSTRIAIDKTKVKALSRGCYLVSIVENGRMTKSANVTIF